MKWDNRDLFCHDLPSRPLPERGKVLVTGATGYIGGRLVPELIERGYSVRIMVRAMSPEYRERWPETEIVIADALNENDLTDAMDGIHTAYYLIHSMLLGPEDFESADRQAAKNFRKAAEKNDLKRIIYLGALGDIGSTLSPHLRSRLEVAEELQEGSIPVTILRAAIIIGSGSASYEIIRHLERRLPVHLMPPWSENKCQPIAIRDVIKYLVGVLEKPETAGRSFDIGGKDVLTYKEMLRLLAGLRKRKRLFLSCPFTNIGVYSYISSLFTPVPAPIVWCLMEGLKNEVICECTAITKILPFRPLSYKEAILMAMSREEQDKIHTRWSDAYPPAHELALKLNELERTPNYIDSYSIQTSKSASSLFSSFCRIGGEEGWYTGTWMWKLRGYADRLLMGVGTSRGRRATASLKINDVIDFWRVEDMKQNESLLLRAEMKVPGKAWLEFKIVKEKESNRLYLTAYYDTKRIAGRIYWYSFLPFHYFIFNNLLRQIEIRS